MATFLLLVVGIVLIALVVHRFPPSEPASATRGRIRSARVDRIGYQRAPSTAEAIRQSTACWVSAGRGVAVAGRPIPGGMLYVGQELVSLDGYQPDPALINPRLPVASRSRGVTAANMGYWPSYSRIEPFARASYLEWLVSGRRDPRADIGYVFLFFYGIERRALFDARHLTSAREEIPVLVREVQELLDVYGENNSFRGYATSFLAVASVQDPSTSSLAPPRPSRFSYEIPFAVKMATGRYVAAGKPIPAEWAFSWLSNHPEIRLRTPGTRCPEEFESLFLLRYQDRYGEGMTLKRNKTNVVLTHRMASATSREPVRIDLDIPDVTRLTGPVGRLKRLAEEVQKDLEPYSRWVGKTDDRTSVSAVALLPPALAKDRLSSDEPLLATVERALHDTDVATISTSGLLEHWPSKEPDRLTKQEASMMAEVLALDGVGVEPDVRYGASNLSKSPHTVVFRLPADAPQGSASAELDGASALLHLGALVASADGHVSEEEEQLLSEQVDALPVTVVERTRLHARLRWYLANPPSTASLKRVLERLAEVERRRIARVLLAVAGADGFVDASELRSLRKIYNLLGLDPDALYGDVHEMSVPNATGPVTVLAADEGPGYPIPSRGEETVEPQAGVQLDVERVAAIRVETGEVSRVLGAVFAEDEGPDSAVGEELLDSTDSEDSFSEPLHGLDFAHSQLLLAIASKNTWPRPEFEAMAREHGLMAGGAIELINEAAFNACDEPLLEGQDPIEVNRYAFEEMTA